jgi:hypothetical protein
VRQAYAHYNVVFSEGSINRNCALGGLSGNCATINWQVDARDEAALLRSEKHGGRCKFICCSCTAIY